MYGDMHDIGTHTHALNYQIYIPQKDMFFVSSKLREQKCMLHVRMCACTCTYIDEHYYACTYVSMHMYIYTM